VEQQERKRGNKTVCVDAREASLCPPPDYKLRTVERDYFLEAVREVCDSAFLQVMDRGGYNERARENRERISRDARKQAEYVAVLNRGRGATMKRVA